VAQSGTAQDWNAQASDLVSFGISQFKAKIGDFWFQEICDFMKIWALAYAPVV